MTGRFQLLNPDEGITVEITGAVPGAWTMNALTIVPFAFPGLLTVRLYDPGERLPRAKVPVIFVAENEVTVPGMVDVALSREITAPGTNFDPDIVTVTGPVMYPEEGDTDTISGAGLCTVNSLSLVTDDPSVLRTVRL